MRILGDKKAIDPLGEEDRIPIQLNTFAELCPEEAGTRKLTTCIWETTSKLATLSADTSLPGTIGILISLSSSEGETIQSW